jgi:hypothetical protein
MDGNGGPRAHNGPALAGHGAEAVRDAIATTITTLPAQLRRSLTWDQGAEMASHTQPRIDTGLAIYFCDPHSPWQRGTNENINGCCASTSRGRRPEQTQPRRPLCCRRRPQRAPPQDPRLEDARRSPQQSPTLDPAMRRYDDPLNLGWLPTSLWWTSPARSAAQSRLRVHMACASASSTSWVVI